MTWENPVNPALDLPIPTLYRSIGYVSVDNTTGAESVVFMGGMTNQSLPLQHIVGFDTVTEQWTIIDGTLSPGCKGVLNYIPFGGYEKV